VQVHEPFFRVGTDCGICTGSDAWEVALRWSYLDLNDGAIQGGYLDDTTVGLNWYLHAYMRMMFNYIYADLNDPVAGESDAHILDAPRRAFLKRFVEGNTSGAGPCRLVQQALTIAVDPYRNGPARRAASLRTSYCVLPSLGAMLVNPHAIPERYLLNTRSTPLQSCRVVHDPSLLRSPGIHAGDHQPPPWPPAPFHGAYS
jgi:hypothetical protein